MRTAIALLALVLPAAAQTATTAPTAKDSNQLAPNIRLYAPKNINEARARQVAEFINSVLGRGVRVDWDDVPHCLVIRSPVPGDLDAAEVLLKRFDVSTPQPAFSPAMKRAGVDGMPDLDCVVYLIRASRVAAQPGHPEPPTVPMPAELQTVVDEMKQSFAYNHYAVWDTQTLHPGGGPGDFQGMLPQSQGGDLQVYNMSYKAYFRAYTGGMEISDFLFSIKSSNLPDGFESHIKTNVNLQDGKKLVLGKIRLTPAESADLFLVLTTKPR